MSERVRISRRNVLRLGTLAPLAAVAASGASLDALAQTGQSIQSLPEQTSEELKGRARAHFSSQSPPPADVEALATKFALVASALWLYFKEGAASQGVAVPADTDPQLHPLILAAYDVTNTDRPPKKSGDLILMNLGDWDDWAHEPVTNYCAYLTGRHAADIAKERAPTLDAALIVTPGIYRQAYRRTELKMKRTMMMVRSLQERRGVATSAMSARASTGGGC